ncbi:chemotaxis protein CheW [Cognatilysobacter bugurensis]|uniref:CheW-like domain-containing protein n=1 Tax=Cognatilysobacter bugurensis TaxID=543356 RepID=A0A918WAB8_9GAMM|nr:hypothetical protein GCM10007067_28320 [Lysobacter bugurensis]
MSKKNRQKSRAAQRPSVSAPAPAAAAPHHASAASADNEQASSDVEAAAETSAAAGVTDHAVGSPTATQHESAETVASAGGDDAAPQEDFLAVGAHADAEALDAPEASPQPVAKAEAPTPQPFTVPTPAPMASQGDIRGVLIQVAGARLLMPNATIAEVLSYADPEPVGEDAPEWLLGRLRWRGWQVPLIAFGTLAGVAQERAVLGSKVVVLKALAGTSRTPYFAMLTQGFPRLVTVSRQTLSVEDDDASMMPRGVQARVRLNEDPALLPDLEAIEAIVADAVAQAA